MISICDTALLVNIKDMTDCDYTECSLDYDFIVFYINYILVYLQYLNDTL